jgi:hypothetical protein
VRVEIHRGGGCAGKPTLKWAWDNGSNEYRIARAEGSEVVLRDWPRDCRHGLVPGVFVEALSEHHLLLGRPGRLCEIEEVDDDGDEFVLRLKRAAALSVKPVDATGGTSVEDDDDHDLGDWAILRRWDHAPGQTTADSDGAVPVPEPVAAGPDPGVELARGLRVAFDAPPGVAEPRFLSGDWWSIPVRIATGDVIWRRNPVTGDALYVPPEGVEHQYAPLALVRDVSTGPVHDLRSFIKANEFVLPA